VKTEAARPATATDRLLPLLGELLARIDRDDIVWCLPRDGHRLDALSDGGELDLLVSPADVQKLEGILRDLRFVRLPGWGYSPHRFFVAYDEAADAWLKVDLVDRIAFGRPVHALASDLGERCLRNRRRLDRVWTPAPEDELVTLLLHCWLDKGSFGEEKRTRLRELADAVEEPDVVTGLLADHGVPEPDWTRISRLIDVDDWSILLGERSRVAQGLRARDGAGTVARWLRDRSLRKLGRALRIFGRPALTVALLAPDGAGKSTLSQSIRDGFFFPMRSVYMGLYQKDARWGSKLSAPGFGFVVRIVRQWIRWAGARWQAARGRFVIFDRYSYDALLPPTRRIGALARARRWLLARSVPAPDVVFVLDAPGEVLHARKGEHTPEKLEVQRQQYLALRSRLPGIEVIDVTRDLPDVRREITSTIWRRYAKANG
jgi:thymidylate kinase